MKNIIKPLPVFLIIFLLPLTSHASSNDTTTINYQVLPINEITLVTRTIDFTPSFTPGFAFEFTSSTGNNRIYYNISTNCAADSKKITIQLNSDLTTGTTMYVNAGSGLNPTGADGHAGFYLTGGTTADTFVSNINAVAESNRYFNMYLNANIDATKTGGRASRNFTLTLCDNS
jgi:hypothetical protein